MVPIDAQIRAILGGNAFGWAVDHLPAGATVDSVRFRDLISVSEDDVVEFVNTHGFDERMVAEQDDADDHLCIVARPDGRWLVYYTERGHTSEETIVPTLAAARREVVQRLMVDARIALNHRFRLAHPELDLPRPDEMD